MRLASEQPQDDFSPDLHELPPNSAVKLRGGAFAAPETTLGICGRHELPTRHFPRTVNALPSGALVTYAQYAGTILSRARSLNLMLSRQLVDFSWKPVVDRRPHVEAHQSWDAADDEEEGMPIFATQCQHLNERGVWPQAALEETDFLF
jgi:hypothetical protein